MYFWVYLVTGSVKKLSNYFSFPVLQNISPSCFLSHLNVLSNEVDMT